ncbi:hypothetical protein L2095_07865 [Bacillus zanthoxyli]|nr:hypothetical protein [Bacillus zanthoxyli]
MNQLDTKVKQLEETLDEEYVLIKSLGDTHQDLMEKQAEKLRETAMKLMPIMKKICNQKRYFSGIDTDYHNSRGPVFKHDGSENKLYVFSVKDERPLIIDLFDEKNNMYITYRKLLQEVDFSVAMDSLLLVLDHHEKLKRAYQNAIDEMESALSKYEDVQI